MCEVPARTLTKKAVCGIISPMQFSIAALPKPKICKGTKQSPSNPYPKKAKPNFGFASTFSIKSLRDLIGRPLRGGFRLHIMQASKIRAKTIANATLELIYPRFCPICGRGLESPNKLPLCEICHREIRLNTLPSCVSREKSAWYFDVSHSVAIYEGVMRECIHKFKYNGNLALEKLFADLMADFAKKHMDLNRFDCIIPVPLHHVKLRERTFNQAAILARSISRKFKVACIGSNLVRVVSGKSQIALSRSRRAKDIEGAFKVRNSRLLKDKSVLLIDDVFTTGATVNECSKVLKRAGAAYIEVLTLARGI